jgi:hypothetical protein
MSAPLATKSIAISSNTVQPAEELVAEGKVVIFWRFFIISFLCLERTFTDNMLGNASDKGILIGIIFFVIQGFVFWILTIALENGIFSRLFMAIRRRGKVSNYTQMNQVIFA